MYKLTFNKVMNPEKKHALTDEQLDYIKQRWKNFHAAALASQNQLLNWVFTFNLAGAAGMLTYLAANTTAVNNLTPFSVVAFLGATIFLIYYGIIMYYWERNLFYTFKNQAIDTLQHEMSWEKFSILDSEIKFHNKLAEKIAWLSGLLTLLGTILAVISIYKDAILRGAI